MEDAKRVAVNIVAWNSMAYIPNVLASLDEQDTREFMVTIVDNASSDGIVPWLAEHRPDVAVLRNMRNQGFSRAHNQAIALAFSRWNETDLDQRYVLVANPDLEFAPDAIRLLTTFMDEHPDIAACGPKLLRAVMQPGDDERRETLRSRTIDSTGLVITKARRAYDRGAGEEDAGQYDQVDEVFGFSGACVMFRASALRAVACEGEIFDEDIFAYKEDVDLAWRMKRCGYRAMFVPHAVVWHHRRAPSAPRAGLLRVFSMRRKKSPYVNYLSSRNHGWVLLKNDDVVNALVHLPWWLSYEILKACGALASFSALKGEVASFLGIPKMYAKRRVLADRAVVPRADIRRWFV